MFFPTNGGFPKWFSFIVVVVLVVLSGWRVHAADSVPVVPADDHRTVQYAAEELSHMLEKTYEHTDFDVRDGVSGEDTAIVLGGPDSSRFIRRMINPEELDETDAFVVRNGQVSGKNVGVIAGENPRGVLFGVYELLEELGHGFYLSYNTFRSGSKQSFSFEPWDFSDRPLAGPRIVFNWHNFLSSSSTWNVSHWRSWIQQAARMRYSGIMVHLYGNNPMYQFSHNGKTKQVGYITTTARGRDWGTPHVNDVRRLYGGQAFDHAIFGADAAKVSPERRVKAAEKLMQKSFDEARKRDMNVYFGIDVDTASANPQNIVKTLPKSARFQSPKGKWLPNPDTEAGRKYYRSIIKHFLETYPQITDFVLWHRHTHTPWTRLSFGDFPQSWKQPYRQALERHPHLKDNKWTPGMFAFSRIVRAFKQILEEMGREDVDLATGTWGFEFMSPKDLFLPDDVTLMPLDVHTKVGTSEFTGSLSSVRDARRRVPIIWAQHDVDKYIGRSYTPTEDFASTLRNSGSTGFGIIHWLTRPFDLFFKNHVQQVWERSENQSLSQTARSLARRTFGKTYENVMGTYLERWVRNAPLFGSANMTTDRNSFSEVEQWMEDTRNRLSLLENVDPAKLREEGRCHYRYFKNMERFFLTFLPQELRRR